MEEDSDEVPTRHQRLMWTRTTKMQGSEDAFAVAAFRVHGRTVQPRPRRQGRQSESNDAFAFTRFGWTNDNWSRRVRNLDATRDPLHRRDRRFPRPSLRLNLSGGATNDASVDKVLTWDLSFVQALRRGRDFQCTHVARELPCINESEMLRSRHYCLGT